MAYDTEYFQGKSVDEKHERAYWRRIGVEVVAILIAAFLLGSALYAGKVYAGPRVYSPQECGIAADMVLVAAALLKHKASDKQTDGVMSDAYANQLNGEHSKRWYEIMAGARRLASRPQARGIAPIELAEAFAQDCQNNRGNLDPIFGTAL